jgi:anthranilate phosphoribosyltransferase
MPEGRREERRMPPSDAGTFAVQPLLERLLADQDLEDAAAREFMEAAMAGRVPPSSLAAFLMALRAKGESESELAAFAAVLREKAVRVQAPPGTLDTCGTGGDRSATFNISTAVALTVAGMGVPVAKHGNRSVSSHSGSADALKVLGVNIEASVPVLERCLRECGLAFLFAPAHHPSLKHAAGVRRELGVRTVFNLLGPLANPALARRQLLGVFEPRWCEAFARVLKRLGSEAAVVASGVGPEGRGHLDEVSTWGPTTLAWLKDGQVRTESFEARSLGFAPPPPGSLNVKTPEESARKVREVLAGKPGPAREIVLANAAAAAQVAGRANSWNDGVTLAAEALDGARAAKVLERLIALSNQA